MKTILCYGDSNTWGFRPDTKTRYDRNERWTGIDGKPPQVLLLAPPRIAKLTEFAAMYEGAGPKSELLSQEYARVVQENGCAFLDTAEIIAASDIDGVHLGPGEHRKLGLAVAAKVCELI